MKGGKILCAIIILFIGIIIGVAISLSIGAVLSYTDLRILPTSYSKTFGDIKIVVQKALVAEDTEVPSGSYEEYDKELWMTRDDIPFLLITQNVAGRTNGLYLLNNNKKEPVLFARPLGPPGKWGKATYSKAGTTGKPVGDVFTDIDFDGRFDFKLVVDANKNYISRFIFTGGAWQEVYPCSVKKMRANIGRDSLIFVDGAWQKVERWSTDNTKAFLGQTEYFFDPNSGWCKE